MNPATRTASAERIATVKRERLQVAAINATIVPTSPVHKLPVEYKTYGNVIADSTAYGI